MSATPRGFSTPSEALGDALDTLDWLAQGERLLDIHFGQFAVGDKGYYYSGQLVREIGNTKRDPRPLDEQRKAARRAVLRAYQEFMEGRVI